MKVVLPAGGGLCSGTVLSDKAVLTAAHCTTTGGTYTVIGSGGSATTSQAPVQGGPGVLDDPNDVSLLVFPSGGALTASGGSSMGFAPEVNVDEIVRLVGYGCTSLSTRRGAGVKRTGTNQIYRIDDYIELVTPPYEGMGILGAENRAGSCYGDSGGPALRHNGSEYQIVGVAHSGGLDGESNTYSYYVNAIRSDNGNFLRSANSTYSLDIQGL